MSNTFADEAADQPGPQSGVDWRRQEPASLRCVMVFIDCVESVRRIDRGGRAAVCQWTAWLEAVRHRLLPAHGARLVKLTGDGLLAALADVGPAMALAGALHDSASATAGLADMPEPIRLRIGLHLGEILDDGTDFYGHDANLAARMMAVAEPGQTVVSDAVRDQLGTSPLARLEDLGDCHVKGVSDPVRLFVVGSAMPPSRLPVESPTLPRLAVLATVRGSSADQALAGWVAESLTSRIARTRQLCVISSLSAAEASRHGAALGTVATALRADLLLGIRCTTIGTRCTIGWELIQASDDSILDADTVAVATELLFEGAVPPFDEIAAAVVVAVNASTLRNALAQPPENLDAYTLQTGAISLMHGVSAAAFERGGELLTALVERYPRMVGARPWLAKWHVLRVTRGLATDRADEARRALAHTRIALQRQPHDAMALAVDGFVHCHLLRDLGQARHTLEQALDAGPNEPLAWLFTSAINAFEGRGIEAMQAADQALSRSPADPLQHYFYSLAATAALSAGEPARALELATWAYRLNRMHASTVRVMAIAQIALGMRAEAARTMHALRRMQPGLTVRSYVDGFPAGPNGVGRAWGAALGEAGLPA